MRVPERFVGVASKWVNGDCFALLSVEEGIEAWRSLSDSIGRALRSAYNSVETCLPWNTIRIRKDIKDLREFKDWVDSIVLSKIQ